MHCVRIGIEFGRVDTVSVAQFIQAFEIVIDQIGHGVATDALTVHGHEQHVRCPKCVKRRIHGLFEIGIVGVGNGRVPYLDR